MTLGILKREIEKLKNKLIRRILLEAKEHDYQLYVDIKTNQVSGNYISLDDVDMYINRLSRKCNIP